MTGIRIAATGHYSPERVVTNDDMARLVDTNDEWISTRTGIKTRCLTTGESTAQLGWLAGKAALDQFDGNPDDIGLLVCSTITPDFHTPSIACVIQGQLGLRNAFCFDISAACSGFVYALDIAQSYLALGKVKAAMVISSECLTRLVNFQDRSTCVLFGDGAGACVVTASDNLYASYARSDGASASVLYASCLYAQTPFEEEEKIKLGKPFPYEPDGFIWMNGKEVYKFSTAAMPEAVKAACERAGISVEDLKWIVPHQANIRIVQTGMKHLGLPFERAYMNIERYGNSSSSTIPVALDEMNRGGLLQRGDKFCVVGFGAGLTWGAAVMEW